MSKAEKKSYEIEGITFIQSELTLGQDLELAELFAELELKDLANAKVIDLVRMLKDKKELIPQFLGVILRTDSEYNPEVFLKMTNSTLSEVVQDFFTFNPLLSSALSVLKSTADITK